MTGNLNGLDIAILTIIGISSVMGVFRGLVKEVLSLVTWVLAFVLAIFFSAAGAEMIPQNWGGEGVRVMLAFAGIFLATLIVAGIVQMLVAQILSTAGLSGIDRLLGLLFGGARGLLVCILLLMGLREIASDQVWWHQSILRDQLLAFEDEIRDLLGQGRALVDELPRALPQDTPLSLPEVRGGRSS